MSRLHSVIAKVYVAKQSGIAGPGGDGAVRLTRRSGAPGSRTSRGRHMHQFTRRLTAGSAAAALAVVGFASPAMADHSATPPADYGSAGDETIVVPINDSEAG